MSDKSTRTLVVTGYKPIANIKNKSGGQSTLYEVYATDANGNVIEESLRSFTELEEGVTIDYTIERYTHERYGTSYTLTPPRRNTPKRLRELEEEMERLVMWAKGKGYSREEFEKHQRDRREAESKEREEMQNQAHNDQPDYEEPPPLPPAEEPAVEQTTQQDPTPAPDRPDLDEKYGEEAPWTDEDIGPPPSEEPPTPPKDMELG